VKMGWARIFRYIEKSSIAGADSPKVQSSWLAYKSVIK
jgi:hypothetical protein